MKQTFSIYLLLFFFGIQFGHSQDNVLVVLEKIESLQQLINTLPKDTKEKMRLLNEYAQLSIFTLDYQEELIVARDARILSEKLDFKDGEIKGIVDSVKSNIIGKLQDTSQHEVIYASVVLIKNDSTVVNSAISDTDGKFKFFKIEAGTYKLIIKHIEFETYTSDSFEVLNNEKVIPAITLNPAKNTLDEVVITQKKALIQVKADKIIFNVASSPSASGTNGLDLLKKSPGVTVDMDDNISLLGKSGVQIYINDVPSRLSGNDLSIFLQSMSSDNIDSIEIISNPSSRYDAEGNAGIINIRLKKNSALGFNGSETSSFTKGRFYRYSNSLSLNYGGEKTKINFGVGQSFNKNYDNFLITREQNDALLNENSKDLRQRNGYNISLGLETQLTENQILIFSGRSVINQNDNVVTSQTDIFDTNPTELSQILLSKSIADSPSQNHTFNLSHQLKLGNLASLNSDLSLGFYKNDRNTQQPNTYFEADGTTIQSIEDSEFDNNTNIDLWSLKTDFEKQWTNTTFSAGVKYSHITTKNSLDFYNIINQSPEYDITKSNDFNYTENVSALYAILNIKLTNSVKLNAGLRIENTASRGLLISDIPVDNSDIKRNFTDFFPNVGLSFDNQKNHVWSINVGRRITRPNYQNLNPFETPISQITVWKGNPFLKPNYIMNYQASYSYKQKLIITNSYSVINDFFATIFEISGDIGNQMIPRNMKRSTNYGISISYPLEVTKYWEFVTFFEGSQQTYDGNLEGTVIDLKITNYNFRIQNNIKLPWGILMDLTYVIRSDWIWRGSVIVKGNQNLGFGLRKDFLNKKLQIRVTGADIFRTNSDYYFNGDYGGIKTDGVRSFDSQRFGLGATYMFGNQKAKNKVKTNSALDEELNRIEN